MLHPTRRTLPEPAVAARPSTVLALGLAAVLAALLATVLASPLYAPPAYAAQQSTGPISATVDPAQDRQIERGLRERYARIEGLEGVAVEVDAGVVQLSGEVISLARIEEAESIARRTEGVAEVVNRLELSSDLESRVVPALVKLEDRLTDFLAWLPLLAVALLLLVGFYLLGRALARRDGLIRRLSPNPFVQDLARQVVRGVVLLVGVLLALDLLEATALVGAVLGTAGVLGLAVGFAFRDLVENYIASVLLSLRQPFSPNDLVSIDGREGKVMRLTSRATILMTFDGNHLRIPNAQVFKGVIVNYSRNPLRRFDFAVGVGAGEELSTTEALGVETLRRVPGVLAEPGPEAMIQELGDSNVVLRFYGWVDQRQASLVRVKSEGMRQVKEAFDEVGIDMPEPIYRLRGELPAEVTAAGRGAAGGKPAEADGEAKKRAVVAAVAQSPAASSAEPGDPIDRQIAAERQSGDEPDLLDDAAPKE